MKHIFILLLLTIGISGYSQDTKREAAKLSDKAIRKMVNKDYKGAILDFSKAIKLDPKSAGEYHLRGSCKEKLEDYRGAMLDYNQAIKLKPTDVDSFLSRAQLKYKRSDYRGAINDYNKIIELKPMHPEIVPYTYYFRGLSKIKIKKTNEGCLDLSKAGELGFEDAYDDIKEYCN